MNGDSFIHEMYTHTRINSTNRISFTLLKGNRVAARGDQPIFRTINFPAFAEARIYHTIVLHPLVLPARYHSHKSNKVLQNYEEKKKRNKKKKKRKKHKKIRNQ